MNRLPIILSDILPPPIIDKIVLASGSFVEINLYNLDIKFRAAILDNITLDKSNTNEIQLIFRHSPTFNDLTYFINNRENIYNFFNTLLVSDPVKLVQPPNISRMASMIRIMIDDYKIILKNKSLRFNTYLIYAFWDIILLEVDEMSLTYDDEVRISKLLSRRGLTYRDDLLKDISPCLNRVNSNLSNIDIDDFMTPYVKYLSQNIAMGNIKMVDLDYKDYINSIHYNTLSSEEYSTYMIRFGDPSNWTDETFTLYDRYTTRYFRSIMQIIFGFFCLYDMIYNGVLDKYPGERVIYMNDYSNKLREKYYENLLVSINDFPMIPSYYVRTIKYTVS